MGIAGKVKEGEQKKTITRTKNPFEFTRNSSRPLENRKTDGKLAPSDLTGMEVKSGKMKVPFFTIIR